ncbi:MAG: hypothetical protein UY41_C0045G0004 [Candidatus Moranbacteria bacterium GW2011_GWE1_49_15]|nr:MAG: hypothetical protein UY41_C0045G0004 [Candidatus Moranbacteria bacterium GW2011_GWE1_49_15]
MEIKKVFFGIIFGVVVSIAAGTVQAQTSPSNPCGCFDTNPTSYCMTQCQAPTTVDTLPQLEGNQTGGQMPIQDPSLAPTNGGSLPAGGGAGCEGDFENIGGGCFPVVEGLSTAPIYDIISGFLIWVMAIFGILSIMAFVISGIQYVTSAGDESQIDTAKRNMKWSSVGVLVGLSGFIIIQAISRALTGAFPYF